MSGVRLEVAHVSSTSSSGSNVVVAHSGTGVDRRVVREGSTGRSAFSATTISRSSRSTTPGTGCRGALTRDEPVPLEPLDPVLVPGEHLLRRPLHLPADLEVLVGLVEHLDVPLLGDEELDARPAALVNVDGVGDIAAVQQRARPSRSSTIASRASSACIPSYPSATSVICPDSSIDPEVQVVDLVPLGYRSGRRTYSTSRCRNPSPCRRARRR